MKRYTHLLDAIEPTHYQLDLKPDLDKLTFTGRETITFRLKKANRSLTFHASGLQLRQITLDGLSPVEVGYHKVNQTASFEFANLVEAGEHKLKLSFEGKLQENLHGFYLSQYIHAGQKKYLATTQFEATHAREAFVCIDEPAAKAVFEVSLTIDKALTAISNTNIVSETVNGQHKTCQFATTPKMSTYLLAFIVGEFERVQTTSRRGVEIGVCTTPGKIHQADYALEVGRKVLDYYEDYFGIDYPLPKLDMIAIPDFSSGAMENWGAVTYRETAILIDPKNSALGVKQWAAMVIAHELAHQWFGNLVTMTWWTDLWLNEGFASWIEYLAIDHLEPDWLMWEQFVAHDYQQARKLDCLKNTHPIEVEVNHPGEINEIFDDISYQKGASVIRMLHEYLGEADFKRGLHNYLKKFSYGNAVTADLWQELERATGKPVKTIMSSWTKQPGYPIVSIKDNIISQQRFYSDPAARQQANVIWPVPLRLTTPAGVSQPTLADKNVSKLHLKPAGWVKPNSDQASLVVVDYNAEMLRKLYKPIKAGELSAIDRFGVISDSVSLNEAGRLDAAALLELISKFTDETNYIVWDGILSGLHQLGHITTDENTYDQLQDFNRTLLQPIYQRLGDQPRKNEHHFDSLLRPVVLSSLAKTGHEPVIKLAQELFAKHLQGDPITPNLRSFVYTTIGRWGQAKDYDAIEKLYREADLQEEKRRLFAGLAASKQPELIERTLTMSLSDAVRPADSVIYLIQLMISRYAKEQAWQFVQDNWSTFDQRYRHGHLMRLLPVSLGNGFVTRQKASEIKAFFEKNKVPGIERSVAQAIEQILIYDAWRKRDEKTIASYLKNVTK